jgi:hypothetical protein
MRSEHGELTSVAEKGYSNDDVDEIYNAKLLSSLTPSLVDAGDSGSKMTSVIVMTVVANRVYLKVQVIESVPGLSIYINCSPH